MFFDMGIGELLMIGVVGLIVFGPDRLPRVAAQAAQFLRQLRDQANQAKASIIEAADIDESTLRDLRDLDPRRALREVTSPLEDVRRTANDALRVDAPRPATPAPPAAAPASSAEAGAAEPGPTEGPRIAGIDEHDII